MKIIHIAAELAPIAKVGGLGDVLQGLTEQLSHIKHDVHVILPKYKSLKKEYLKNLKIEIPSLRFHQQNLKAHVKIHSAKMNNVKIHLIDPKNDYFEKDHIYGYKNDVDRFLYFCLASMEYLLLKHKKIDILHIHDWHTSILPILYRDKFLQRGLQIKGTVLSIHNLKYQGLCKPRDLDNIGLNGKSYLISSSLQDPRRPKTLNLLKGGLEYSDMIIPVSPTYAEEIMTKKNGCDLDHVLRKRKSKVKGILNGIDKESWNPKIDKALASNFSKDLSMKELIERKIENKRALQKSLNLPEANVPLVCNIGRLVQQKSPLLIKHAIKHTLKKSGQFVLLGSFSLRSVAKTFNKLKKDLSKNPNGSLNYHYSDNLAHLIFAAADFIIIPSVFEPCGLTQMIAFQYGSIPIVRETGGLADTVFDLDDKKIVQSKRNGFTFKNVDIEEFKKALNRAFSLWLDNPTRFYQIIKNNMKIDHSWKKSAKEYLSIYKKLLK